MPSTRTPPPTYPSAHFTAVDQWRYDVARASLASDDVLHRRAAFASAFALALASCTPAAERVVAKARAARPLRPKAPAAAAAAAELTHRAVVAGGRGPTAHTRKEARFRAWRKVKEWGFLEPWHTPPSPLRRVLFAADDDDDAASDTDTESDGEVVATPPEIGLTPTFVDLDIEMIDGDHGDDGDEPAPAPPSLKRRAEDEPEPETHPVRVNQLTYKRRRLAPAKRVANSTTDSSSLESLAHALPTATFTGPSRSSDKIAATTASPPTSNTLTSPRRPRALGRFTSTLIGLLATTP